MGHFGRGVVAGALLAIAAVGPRAVDALVFDFNVKFESLKMEILSEGPMWSTEDAPFSEVSTKTSMVDLVLEWYPESANDVHMVGVVFTENATLTKAGGLPAEVVACKGDITTDQYTAHYYAEPGTIDVKYNVKATTEGENYPRALIFVCPCAVPSEANGLDANDPKLCWSGGNKQGVQFHGQVAFSNSYGFLPASDFPLLPFYASLTLAHFVLLGIFVALCFWFRENLVMLHYAVVFLAAIGMLESALYFVLFIWKNFTGINAWPPTPLQWVASLVGVGKRALGRVLLLSVGLGYGVVKPKLDAATIGLMTVVTLLFAGSSAWKELAADVLFASDPQAHSSPIMVATDSVIIVLDAVILGWCLVACLRTQAALKKQNQLAKMKMYNALVFVMAVMLIVWSIFEVYCVAVQKHFVAINWQLSWLIHSFWHIASFVMLITIAVVWKPSASSQDLSYWVQVEMVDFDDGGNDEDGKDVVDLEELEFDDDLDYAA